MGKTGHKRFSPPQSARHVPFAMVLAGGGARGLAHAGALRALEHYGYRPKAVVGVSMGAVVAVTYALNPDWYAALVNLDVEGFPAAPKPSTPGLFARLRALAAAERLLQNMVFGWGIGAPSLDWGRRLLDQLTLGKTLEEGRIPVATVATDLGSGKRVVLDQGSAAVAALASAALAGIVPPLVHDGLLLVDGAYADLVPVDVARRHHTALVIAVDPYQDPGSQLPRNGVQAMLKAMEICAREHANLRFAEADLVLRPRFPFPIDTLEFFHKRVAIAAGARAVRAMLVQLRALLDVGQSEGP